MNLRNLRSALKGTESPEVQYIINLMERSDERSPLKKSKDDTLTTERIIELEEHAEMGNNVISNFDLSLINETDQQHENRKKIDSYIEELNSRISNCESLMRIDNENIQTIEKNLGIFTEIYNHISDKGHLTQVIELLNSKDVENNSDLQWVIKAQTLYDTITSKQTKKIEAIQENIKILNEELDLLKEEKNLILEYDKYTNYLDLDKFRMKHG